MILDDAYHTLEALSLNGFHNTLAAPDAETSDHPAIMSNEVCEDVPTIQLDDEEQMEHERELSTVIENRSTKSSHLFPGSGTPVTSDTTQCAPQPRLLVLSAKDESALQRSIQQYSEHISTHLSNAPEKVERLSYMLAARKSLMAWRTFVVTSLETTDILPFSSPVRASRETGLAFVYTGQGAQYANMGRGLLHFRRFRETLEDAQRLFQKYGAEWSFFGNSPLHTTIPH